MLGASLVCGGTGGAPVTAATVTPSPFNSNGSAEIEQVVTMPATCIGPVVLVRAFTASAPLGSQLGAFIAATGLTANAQNQNQNQNQNENQDNEHQGGSGHGN
jgi:hypothetical protein